MTKRLLKSIIVRTEFVGFHCWPDAPAEVDFLRTLHRHLFKVEAQIVVDHSDRSVEFFICQGHIDSIIQDSLCPQLIQEPSMSCEMMAEYIMNRLELIHAYVVKRVSVSEDGENAGVVEIYE